MKTITLSADEETYEQAQLAAAQRASTVSALVRDYLRTFASPRGAEKDATWALFSALDRAQGFRAADRLTRAEAHER